MTEFRPGQRWISSGEPELGMGRILKVEDRLVTINFDLVQEVRRYARQDAPLTRVRFTPGDRIRASGGVELTVTRVGERDGILVYQGDYQGTETAIVESELDPNVTFSKPEERLFTYQIDDNQAFNLRYATLVQQARLAALPARGLLGPRVALIPHQFYIAAEVASRYAPRVLLADEVGLGKTIEAGLIMHQQLTTGRARRILVIVPPALKFQWFVEMIRRFNLQFTLLDEARCQDIEADNQPMDDEPGIDNPFEAQQLALCSIDLFLGNPVRLDQARAAQWDLIVVDEAHHLAWHDGEPGPDYLAVEQLSAASKGLLLLTATPEQLGRRGHFSRLRLLDPSRYHDYEEFLDEENRFEELAGLIRDLETTPETVYREIRRRLGDHAPVADDALLPALLDRHGTGRVLFRNVRESVQGFQARILKAARLDPAGFPATDRQDWHSNDPRLAWLSQLLNGTTDKFLVICAGADMAIALDRYLRERSAVRSVAFHEQLDLVARDRAANYFADTERGAQVLVCSEIGSEGRNFQFAHHLVLYDLPDNPDLLEQRIGRLDRIGQQQPVTIHVPFAAGTLQEKRLRIYDEGLGIFTRPNAAAQLVFDALSPTDDIDSLVQAAHAQSEHQLAALRSGRDRLLERNSHRPAVSAALLNAILAGEASDALIDYMEQSFLFFGLESEPLGRSLIHVKPTETMVRHQSISLETKSRSRYPELPEEGVTCTYDRDTALAREDVIFLTWEHPMVEQALEVVASDTRGNCSAVVVRLAGVPAGTLMVETVHVIECVAPAELNAPRYLPPSVVRTLVTPTLDDIADKVGYRTWDDRLEVPAATLQKIVAGQQAGIRKLLAAAGEFAVQKFAPIKATAIDNMESQLGAELSRLRSLAAVNDNIRTEEIDFLADSQTALHGALGSAQIRLDAVRLIIVTG